MTGQVIKTALGERRPTNGTPRRRPTRFDNHSASRYVSHRGEAPRMIQKEFYTPEIAKDGIDSYLIAGGSYRLVIIHGTELVNRMRANHSLNPGGTIILGQAYLLALLAGGILKNDEKIGILVECDGLVEGISVEANVQGHVRGYLKNREIPVVTTENPAELFGSGTLSILRYADDMRHPARGQVELQNGTLPENLGWYYAKSEQTATLLDINIHFDEEQRVSGAAGFMVQALPGADSTLLDRFAESLASVRPLGRHFADGATAVNLVREHLAPWQPQLIATYPAEFYCSCSKERFGRFLAALPKDERDDILETGPIPLHTTCHNCNSTYTFSRGELEELFIPAGSD